MRKDKDQKQKGFHIEYFYCILVSGEECCITCCREKSSHIKVRTLWMMMVIMMMMKRRRRILMLCVCKMQMKMRCFIELRKGTGSLSE